MEKRREGGKDEGGGGPSKFVVCAPALLLTLGGPEFHMSPHSHSVRALKRRERARGRGSICVQSVKSTHFIILIVGCRIVPPTD